MQLYEKLMGMYPDLNYKFDPLMPPGQKGWINGTTVYLNPQQHYRELNSTVAEEIGHYLTGAGNVIKQDTNEKRKQERKARDTGATLIVTPQTIISSFEAGCVSIWECAEHLQITEELFKDAIKFYARKYDGFLQAGKYAIVFQKDGTVGVLKNLC